MRFGSQAARRSEVLYIPRDLLVSLMQQAPVGMFNFIKSTDIVGKCVSVYP